jgi:hypothetical protein
LICSNSKISHSAQKNASDKIRFEIENPIRGAFCKTPDLQKCNHFKALKTNDAIFSKIQFYRGFAKSSEIFNKI